MPELNGIEAVAKIRELSPATAVIVLSMHSSTEYISRALQAGARGYLVKDSAGAEVVKATRAVCTGRHYLSESISEKVIQDYVRRGLGPIVEDPLTSLTDREREVLQLVVEGKTTAEIADVVSLSPKTIETYRSRILSKLGIRNLPDLVKFAIQHGLTSLER
jgi:DNA-binding NarL/FixJ family response regulator